MSCANLLRGAINQLQVAVLAMAAAIIFFSTVQPMLAAGTPSAQSVEKAQLRTVVIPVQGMVCVACAATVKGALKSVDGVSRVEISLEKRSAQVTYAANKLSADRLVEAINKTGFKAGIPREAE